MTRNYSRNPVEDIYKEIERLSTRVDKMQANVENTAPIRSSIHLPAGIEGQIVIADETYDYGLPPVKLTIHPEDMNDNGLISGSINGSGSYDSDHPAYYNYNTGIITTVDRSNASIYTGTIFGTPYPYNVDDSIIGINNSGQYVLRRPLASPALSQYYYDSGVNDPYDTESGAAENTGSYQDINNNGDKIFHRFSYFVGAADPIANSHIFLNNTSNEIDLVATPNGSPFDGHLDARAGSAGFWEFFYGGKSRCCAKISNSGICFTRVTDLSAPSALVACHYSLFDTTLSTFPLSGFSVAMDISNSGLVVGQYWPTDYTTDSAQLFLWIPALTQVILFDDVHPEVAAGQNQWAGGVNDFNQILFSHGVGGDTSTRLGIWTYNPDSVVILFSNETATVSGTLPKINVLGINNWCDIIYSINGSGSTIYPAGYYYQRLIA